MPSGSLTKYRSRSSGDHCGLRCAALGADAEVREPRSVSTSSTASCGRPNDNDAQIAREAFGHKRDRAAVVRPGRLQIGEGIVGQLLQPPGRRRRTRRDRSGLPPAPTTRSTVRRATTPPTAPGRGDRRRSRDRGRGRACRSASAPRVPWRTAANANHCPSALQAPAERSGCRLSNFALAAVVASLRITRPVLTSARNRSSDEAIALGEEHRLRAVGTERRAKLHVFAAPRLHAVGALRRACRTASSDARAPAVVERLERLRRWRNACDPSAAAASCRASAPSRPRRRQIARPRYAQNAWP